MIRSRPAFAIAATVLAVAWSAVLPRRLPAQPAGIDPAASRTDRIVVETVSTRADRVSGGNVLIRITLPGRAAGESPTVTLNERDVSEAFRAVDGRGTYLGLVSGLESGPNELHVAAGDGQLPGTTLRIFNYPLTGPIVSGPHLQAFVCQTTEFELPDGTTLGPPLDANCSVETRVHHVYRSTEADGFRPLPPGDDPPPDLAYTTTTDGRRVPFIVRVETGTINRGVHQNVVLHDPFSDPEPTPFTPPPAWNRRLIAVHGFGCPTGWYRQGGALGVNPLSGVNATRLGEGYAIFTNTLNHPTNSCNAFLAGEATMMGKEHFIETFGVPSFTVSIGGSGGAYTGLQVADAFPGLIDGVIATSTFPDALSIAIAGLDAHLLTHYFDTIAPDRFTDEQKVAITGYSGVQAFLDAANQAQRTDPVAGREDVDGYDSARWHDVVPEGLRYDPRTNLLGARPTVFDVARNIYGVDPETGYALRPFDNVGVQYGLGALNSGAITVDDFLDINEMIGGYDRDANYVRDRSVGDAGAVRRAYQSGVTLSGAGGLSRIPVMDAGGYNETARYHYQWFHFAVRERMRSMNGHADNHVLWRGAVPAEETWSVMIEWLSAIHESGDGSLAGAPDAAVRAKPARATDGCWLEDDGDSPARFVAEPQTFSSRPDSACNEAYPSFSFVRQVAGGPLHANVLRCQLRPVDAADYEVPFTQSQLARLRGIFPNGVCDWTKPGVGQVPVVPWASFGPAPRSLIYDVSRR